MIPELNVLGSRNFTLCEATSSLIHVTDPPTAMSIIRGSNFPSAMWMVAATAGGFSPEDDVESVPQDVAARAITANNVTAKNRRIRVRFIDAPV